MTELRTFAVGVTLGLSVFVVNDRTTYVRCGCYNGGVSVFVVNDRTTYVHRGCYNGVCLCLL